MISTLAGAEQVGQVVSRNSRRRKKKDSRRRKKKDSRTRRKKKGSRTRTKKRKTKKSDPCEFVVGFLGCPTGKYPYY